MSKVKRNNLFANDGTTVTIFTPQGDQVCAERTVPVMTKEGRTAFDALDSAIKPDVYYLMQYTTMLIKAGILEDGPLTEKDVTGAIDELIRLAEMAKKERGAVIAHLDEYIAVAKGITL
jgi:hypothetical protein